MNNNPTDEDAPILIEIVKWMATAERSSLPHSFHARKILELIRQHDKQHYETRVREAIEAIPRTVAMKSEYSKGYADGATDVRDEVMKVTEGVFE